MLKLIGLLFVYFFAGSFVGCSPIYNVSYDYDETLNPARHRKGGAGLRRYARQAGQIDQNGDSENS
jgi:hypothetical protein